QSDGASMADRTSTQGQNAQDATGVGAADAGTRGSGSLTGCVSCVENQCGTQIDACLGDTACRNGLVCTLDQCLAPDSTGGLSIGSADLTCILGRCFMGDLVAAGTATGALNCLSKRCRTTCTAAIEGGASLGEIGAVLRSLVSTTGPSNGGAPDAQAAGTMDVV